MKAFILPAVLLLFISCKQSEETKDALYSRHLQRKVNLTILHTPAPKDHSQFNLLLLNDGQDMEKLRVRETVDSLYKNGKLQPLVVIGIEAGDRLKEFGVAGKPDYLGRGNKASFYDAFINDELYPFAKKQSGVRKFHSVAITGCSLGGLSAFDIAWNHADKISRAGVFSGSFWWRDKAAEDSSYSDETNRILYAKLKASRKKPQLRYWFYAGAAEEKGDRDKDGIIDVIDDTKDIMALLEKKNLVSGDNMVYRESKTGLHDYTSWRAAFPDFLIWAFGN